jgi:hypothetical protein
MFRRCRKDYLELRSIALATLLAFGADEDTLLRLSKTRDPEEFNAGYAAAVGKLIEKYREVIPASLPNPSEVSQTEALAINLMLA